MLTQIKGLGFGNSFGAFQQYYQTHQLHEDSPDKIAWVGSLSFFLQFAIGAISGPLFDRFGAWVCLLAVFYFPLHLSLSDATRSLTFQ